MIFASEGVVTTILIWYTIEPIQTESHFLRSQERPRLSTRWSGPIYLSRIRDLGGHVSRLLTIDLNPRDRRILPLRRLVQLPYAFVRLEMFNLRYQARADNGNDVKGDRNQKIQPNGTRVGILLSRPNRCLDRRGDTRNGFESGRRSIRERLQQSRESCFREPGVEGCCWNILGAEGGVFVAQNGAIDIERDGAGTGPQATEHADRKADVFGRDGEADGDAAEVFDDVDAEYADDRKNHTPVFGVLGR